MSGNVRQGLVNILEAWGRDEVGSVIRCAKGVHAGNGLCAADARSAADCEVTGWSCRVGNGYVAGA